MQEKIRIGTLCCFGFLKRPETVCLCCVFSMGSIDSLILILSRHNRFFFNASHYPFVPILSLLPPSAGQTLRMDG